MKKNTTTKAHNDLPLGVADFTDMMYKGHPEWSLFAVRAPVEAVSHAFADFRKAKRVLRDVPKGPRKENDSISPLACVVEVSGSGWTVVLRSISYVGAEELAGVPEEAKSLSKNLKTKAITFMGEDTSGAAGYDLYDNGELVERAEWEVGGEFCCWGSKLRQKPKLDTVELEFADTVFRELGIYVPICYARAEGKKTSLGVDKGSMLAVGRADLVEVSEFPVPDYKSKAEMRVKEMAKLKVKPK